MSRMPSPRPTVGSSSDSVSHSCSNGNDTSAPSGRAIRIGCPPPKVFGSGSTMVPSVPFTSKTPCRNSGVSNDSSDWALPPCSKDVRTERCVGTSTGNS